MSIVTDQSVENINERFVALFHQNRDVIAQHSFPLANSQRDVALASFQKLGIPGKRNENYRYSDLPAQFAGEWNIDFSKPENSVSNHDLFHCAVPNLDVCTIVLVNGWFMFAQSVPDNVVAGSLREMSALYPDVYERYYGKLSLAETDGMAAMNTMFAQDGLFLYFKKGIAADKPIHIVNVLTGKKDRLSFFRNLIVAEAGSRATVLFCDHTLTASRFVANGVTEVFAGEDSAFQFYGIQSQHNLTSQVHGLYVNQKRNSNVQTTNITLHCGSARNNIHVRLDDEYCESHLYGLYLVDKNQHVDNFTFVDHAYPNCHSNELFKGVLDDSGSGAFTGCIKVHPDAQKTLAYQSNKNLLLTQDAKFNTKPQLEIYADDVKCSHGATVGQIDDEALFYMRARGIGEKEARILLTYAFAYEVIEKVGVKPLQDEIKSLVEKRFRGELSKCDSCVMCAQTPSVSQWI